MSRLVDKLKRAERERSARDGDARRAQSEKDTRTLLQETEEIRARIETERGVERTHQVRLADADRTGRLAGEREALGAELARLKEHRRNRPSLLVFGAALAVVFAAGALLGTLGGTRVAGACAAG